MTKIRIMIVDDHEVVRLGMRAAFDLEADISIVGEASNGAEALAKMSVLDPQVILMDVRMPMALRRAARSRAPIPQWLF